MKQFESNNKERFLGFVVLVIVFSILFILAAVLLSAYRAAHIHAVATDQENVQ